MKELEIIIERAFAYSLWSGQLKMHEGKVYKHPRGGAILESNNPRSPRLLNCAREEKEIYNAVVWLSEQDDELAKRILIEYEEIQIEKLQEKIDNHRNKIRILKGE